MSRRSTKQRRAARWRGFVARYAVQTDDGLMITMLQVYQLGRTAAGVAELYTALRRRGWRRCYWADALMLGPLPVLRFRWAGNLSCSAPGWNARITFSD